MSIRKLYFTKPSINYPRAYESYTDWCEPLSLHTKWSQNQGLDERLKNMARGTMLAGIPTTEGCPSPRCTTDGCGFGFLMLCTTQSGRSPRVHLYSLKASRKRKIAEDNQRFKLTCSHQSDAFATHEFLKMLYYVLYKLGCVHCRFRPFLLI